jgi:hypothetical protein
MKRIFVIFALAATLVGCAKEDIVREAPRQAIGFGNPFIENSTRAANDSSYSGNKKLTSFKVYGTVTGNSNSVLLYNGNDVTGQIGDAVWGCTGDPQYWIPNCSYKFYAIADATSVSPANAMPTTITYNENTTANGDLMLAIVDDTTNAQATPSKGNPVKFTFTHLLSKAKFSFTKPAYSNTRYTFTVKNIKFVDAYKQGVYTIASGNWGSQTAKGELLFGNLEGNGNITTENAAVGLESANERQFVPATYTASNPLTISFDVVMMLDGKELSTVNHTKTFPVEGEYTFTQNKAYVFNTVLGANNTITFTVEELTGWDSKTDISIP